MAARAILRISGQPDLDGAIIAPVRIFSRPLFTERWQRFGIDCLRCDIAMGGAIGTGLFLGSAQVIQSAGPSIILGYAIGGLIAFLIMRQLGEMIVHEPVAGSFSHFAFKYWGKFPGFLAGWNYWILYILVAMTELTAVAKYINYWWPFIPAWASALFFFIIITLVNLGNVS